MNFLEEFKNPPAKYRIKPFWFWNGVMTKDEIKHQIEEMADKGLGGMFICARQGMTLPYLSKEWFDMTIYACDLAREYGLEAWLYDEYPYPSGMSGGEVLLEHPEAEHTVLYHKSWIAAGHDDTDGAEHVEVDLGWARVLLAKAFPMDNKRVVDWEHGLDIKDMVGNLQVEKIYQKTGLTKYNNKRFFSYGPRKILHLVLPKGQWKIEIYTEGTMGDFKYYGGFFDPCNEKAVHTFINTTHERYKKAVGEQFGISVHGMFSDEVGLLSPIPWSRLLPDKFKERKGYDILSCLPALHNSEFKDSCRIRYDLYNTAHELFRESYHKQIADWCGNNNLLYATEVPSMRQGTQKYSDIIGGDTAHEKLGKSLEWIYDEYIKNYRSNAKSVSSLTRQLGRTYAMIESFHSVGWTMTLQDAKWMIDRLGSSGINLYNFHAFYYTIQDITKHDAPPSQFLQNPYWKHYRKLADYVGRMGVMVTNTEADISIAVLDPATALWTKLGNPFHGFSYKGESEEERQECNKLRDGWIHICKTLLFAQLDYDHLDSELLLEAVVSNGMIKIGKATYSVVILPPCHCMESGTRKKLEEFVSQGGCLIGMDMLPYQPIDEDLHPDSSWRALFSSNNAHFMTGKDKMVDIINLCKQNCLDTTSKRVISGNTKEVISCTRIDSDGNLYVFAANQGQQQTTISLEILPSSSESLSEGVKIEEWKMESGEITDVSQMEGNQPYYIKLGAYESKWLMIHKMGACTNTSVMETPVITIPFKGEKMMTLEGKNICRFGTVDMSFDKKHWEKTEVETFIEQCVETDILSNEKLEFTGDFGTPKKIKAAYPITCYYRSEFEVEQIPEDISLLMDIETVAGEFSVAINGKVVSEDRWESVFVNDQNNQAAFIGDMIIEGKNQIMFQVVILKDEDGIRDPFYLWGSFGVNPLKTGPVLTKMPDDTTISNHWFKGIPYYSGTICLEEYLELPECPEDKFFLELDFGHPVYDCIQVYINGYNLGVKAFTPYQWNCDKAYMREGENRLTVKITNTLANMLDGTYFDYDHHQLVKIEDEGEQ